MGRFPEADKEISKIWICRRCKRRNRTSDKCRFCGSKYLRKKRKDIRLKK